jgi:hypothetical protein
MVESILEQTKKGIALEQRDRENRSEPKASELRGVCHLISTGMLDDKYWSFAYKPANKSEHGKLPPSFKAINQDLSILEKITSMDKSKLKALEEQANEWWYHANKVGTTDTSRAVTYGGKRYYYPSRELDTEKKLISKIEAEGQKIINNLNQVARSEPQILEEADKRLQSLRTVLKVPQSYEEIQQGLPPIEKPAVDFISDLRHAEQGVRYKAKKVLKEAGIDGDAINVESDTFDPRTGRPLINDETDRMIAEARASTVSLESQNKGTQSMDKG